ncbi:hypothetical protein GCM10028778_08130 [Barrientosiimonas marina]|uniref:Tetratricopeptide repeat protein n=1 Tax=Lentibacillus kimchii TaxID=1542911 RepID=A0ABW2UY90_9BACI
MANPPENVILFPKWRWRLEDESLLAIKEKRYEDALEKLNELIDFGIYNQEINIGRLICLMELNRYQEAQDFCETLLTWHDDHYYDYIHIYLTILFQTNQYELLMNQADRELASGKVPDDMTKQFRQLHAVSRRLREEIRAEKTTEYINDLFRSVEEANHVRQYALVEQLRKLSIEPTDQVQPLLADDRVNPVTKTAIFVWFQETGVSEKIHIHKLGADLTVAPEQVPPLRTHPVMQEVSRIIDDQEQENPTLFQFMAQLLRHYLYVRYPFMPHEADGGSIADALMAIGKDYLQKPANTRTNEGKPVSKYVDEIKTCEAIYSTVIDEA